MKRNFLFIIFICVLVEIGYSNSTDSIIVNNDLSVIVENKLYRIGETNVDELRNVFYRDTIIYIPEVSYFEYYAFDQCDKLILRASGYNDVIKMIEIYSKRVRLWNDIEIGISFIELLKKNRKGTYNIEIDHDFANMVYVNYEKEKTENLIIGYYFDVNKIYEDWDINTEILIEDLRNFSVLKVVKLITYK